MARSKFVWLIVFESGNIQFVKAQTISQIVYCDALIEDSDSILSVTKMTLVNNYEYQDAIDILFCD